MSGKRSKTAPTQEIRASRPVIGRYGPHAGRPIYGVPEWSVRICENSLRLIDELVDQAMATEQVIDQLRGKSASAASSARQSIRRQLVRETLPFAYAAALDESLKRDHGPYINDLLETVIAPGLVSKLGRHVAMEKFLGAMQEVRTSKNLVGGAPLLAYIRKIVKQEGLKHHKEYGDDRRDGDDRRPRINGLRDREHTTERIEGSRKYKLVGLDAEESRDAKKSRYAKKFKESAPFKGAGSFSDALSRATPSLGHGSGMLYSRLMDVARNDAERAYVRLLANDRSNADAEREAGLTRGQGKAFRERAQRNIDVA